jgi:NADH-quinone oxidoreductase subunit E
MSVRRLAEDNVQPAEFAFNREFAAQAKVWIKKYPKERAQSAVIPLLMLAQEQDGWVTKRAIETIADMLGMPYIRALEVATFYTQFQLKPVGTRAHVQVCGSTPCMLRGSEALMDVCKRKIHHDPLHRNEAGTLSWEEVECQGACVNAPMVIIFKDAYEDLTPERLEEIIDAFEAGKGAEVKTGPQIDRLTSAPEGGPVTLNDEIKPVRTNLDPQPAEPAAEGTAVPPAEAARPKDTATETNPTVKTPVTAPAASQANDKAAEAGSATKKSDPDPKAVGSTAEGAPAEGSKVAGTEKPAKDEA